MTGRSAGSRRTAQYPGADQMTWRTRMKRLLPAALLLALTLTGCGSSDSDPAPAAPPGLSAPVVSISAVQAGEITFSWPAVATATHYQLMKSADGSSPYVQVGSDLATTSTTENVSALGHDWDNARYMVNACNATTCVSSAAMSSVTAMAKAIAYLKAAHPDAGDELGWGYGAALSADGNTLAVGAPSEDSNATTINGDATNNSATDAGAVYVFVRTGGVWTQQAYIKGNNTEAGDKFGSKVSLSADGNTLAVGAPWEDSNTTTINGSGANNSALNSGAAYVFVRSGTTWTQQAYIKASNAQADDVFWTVGLSGDGNTLAVGATGEDSDANGIGGNQADNTASGAGAVYIYTRSGTTWTQQAYVKAAVSTQTDGFGQGTALSSNGNTLAVGSYYENSSTQGINTTPSMTVSEQGSGAAWVFTRSGTTWTQQAYFKKPTSGVGDSFGGRGFALSGDGDTLAVGSTDNSNSTTINGDQNNTLAPGSGAVYVYKRTTGTWALEAYIKSSNSEQFDSFGTGISLSANGNVLAASAGGEDGGSSGLYGDPASNSLSSAGAVYLFTRSGSTWTQSKYIKAPNPDIDDAFGITALSSDGSVLAVAVAGEDGAIGGIGGDFNDDSASSAGAVYVY